MKENKPRKTYPIEFKQQAVELALASGDIMQTARDLGVDQSNLRWSGLVGQRFEDC